MPDLVGEVVSDRVGNSGSKVAEKIDSVQKMMMLPKYGVSHFWLVWYYQDKV